MCTEPSYLCTITPLIIIIITLRQKQRKFHINKYWKTALFVRFYIFDSTSISQRDWNLYIKLCVVFRWSTSASLTRLRSGIITCVCCWRRMRTRSPVPSRDRRFLNTDAERSGVYSPDRASVCLCRYEFFNELYHRFLLTPKVAMKCLCLQALSIVYGKCCEEIGPFADTKYIVGMLDRVSVQRQITSGGL